MGNDILGEETIKAIKEFGIETNFISVNSEKITGRCDVTLDENQIPTYNLLQDVSYDYIPTENIGNYFDVLYFGTLALRNNFNRNSLNKLLSRNNYKEIFVDVNIRAPYYSKETVEFSLKNATIFKISDEELPIVAETLNITHMTIKDFTETLHKMFSDIKLIIITLGKNGAFAFDCKSNNYFFCPAENVNVVSTVGADDSFGAAFLYNYLCGRDIGMCLMDAAKLSGYVISHKGAVPD